MASSSSEALGQDVKALEHSTLKVPYEVLNKKFRSAQKIVDRESTHVTATATEIEKMLKAEGSPRKGEEVAKLLGVLLEKLTSLKRKAGESLTEEVEAGAIVRGRVEHLKSFAGKTGMDMDVDDVDDTAALIQQEENEALAVQWKRTRLNRMLVDHLLREGLYDSAALLANSLDIQHLTNIQVFAGAREVEESLRSRETSRMVGWCYDNKSKLRKIQSTLELEIRVQEFVELVRKGRRFEAVKHARKYLADSQEPHHMAAVKKCMGLLAFPICTKSAPLHPYFELLSEDRWESLITHFRQDHARLYHLSTTSVLGTVVQAGLAALKTPHCYRPNTQNPNCPVCSEPLSTLAATLPYAHCAHSQLVCAISGEPLNENNPPMLLPSGFVYGTKSLQEMARTGGNKVTCPRSGLVFNHSDAERVFVM